MHRYCADLSFLGTLLAMPVAASAAQIYVTNMNDASVSVIDPETNKIVQTIQGIPLPRGACFSLDGKLAYIVSEEEHALDVVDRKTGAITGKVRLSSRPGIPAMTKDGKYILIGLDPFRGSATHHDAEDSGGEDVVDLSTLRLVKTIPIKEGIDDTFITPDGKYAVAGADRGTFAQIIDLSTMEPAGRIEFDAAVVTIAIEHGPDGSTSRLFVELQYYNGFAVVDFATRKELTRIRFPDPMRFMVSAPLGRPDGPPQYNPTHGTAISPDGKSLWVGSRATNYLYRYSLPDLKLLGKVQMPIKVVEELPQAGDPHWLVITPDGKTVYTCISHFDYVVAVDVEAMKDVAHIPVGNNPGMVMVASTP
jgi:YVTN family beta-propeller protein